MSLHSEIIDLRESLWKLADEVDLYQVQRYAIKFPPPENLGLYRRMRRSIGRVLRQLGLRHPPPVEPWLAGVSYVPHSEKTKALVIWALGTGRHDLRRACERLRALQPELQGRAPVLVTDVADFAFFSRLGWLVEYVPALTPCIHDYAGKKLRYLAWRYRDAPAVPVTAGLRDELAARDLELD
jgi:hypothetical protein